MLSDATFWSALLVLGLVLWLGSHVGVRDSSLRLSSSRIASLAFVLHFGYGIFSADSADAAGWFELGLSSAIAGGFVLGICWIGLPIVSEMYRHTIGALFRAIGGMWTGWRAAVRRKKQQHEWEIRERERQEAYEREAPERARRARAEAERAALLLEHKKRREDARAACELLYNLHAAEVSERYPRSELDAFMAKYMKDDHAVQVVEERGRELQRLIERHHQKIEPVKKPRTLKDLAEWYLAEKARLEALPLDEEIRQMHLIALDERYADLSQELLQGMEP